MKLKEGFVLRPLGTEYIVLGEGLAQVDFNKMVTLNETAGYLWKEVEGKEFTAVTLKNLLLDRYDVSEEIAAKDAKAIAAKWIEAGIAE